MVPLIRNISKTGLRNPWKKMLVSETMFLFKILKNKTSDYLFRIILQRRSSYITRNSDEVPLFKAKHNFHKN